MRGTAVRDRIYADFMMPSRLEAYRGLLETARDAGYAIRSIEGFWRAIGADGSTPPGRHLILRHDVDTDPGTAAAMWAIDKELDVRSSYYFRRSTVDVRLMRDIAAAGGEASYHYEELATIAKRRRIRRPEAALAAIPDAQELFRRELQALRRRTGLPMRVVASHGDFVNRRLGIPNWRILEDDVFRSEVGIDLEAYDEAFARHATSRQSDTGYPRYWVNEDPRAAIARGDPVVSVLVHPRHWRTNRTVNAADDARRLLESVVQRLPVVRA